MILYIYFCTFSKRRSRNFLKVTIKKEKSKDKSKLKVIKGKSEKLSKKNKENKVSFVCVTCEKKFRSEKTWRRHLDKCDFTLDVDIKVEDGKPKISKIQKTRKSPKSWECKVCVENFATMRDFKEHMKTHQINTLPVSSFKFDDDRNLYVCNECSTEFKDESEAEEHIKTHKLSCTSCNIYFDSCYDLGIHSSTHEIDKKIKCPLCAYTSFKPEKFQDHVDKVHLKGKMFYCPTCAKTFIDFRRFQEHQNIHVGLTWSCEVCSSKYHSEKFLIVHQQQKHYVVIQEQGNNCVRCNKYFYHPESVTKHEEQCLVKAPQKKERTHLCNFCGYSFTDTFKLREHTRIHTGEAPYVCTDCGKTFRKKESFKCHERIHTEEKPYSCEYCGKAFRVHQHLRTHKRIHTGERPYVCSFCGQGFITNQVLKFHKQKCENYSLGF